jgi:hypothetical protein
MMRHVVFNELVYRLQQVASLANVYRLQVVDIE